jgi:hypothetical protein
MKKVATKGPMNALIMSLSSFLITMATGLNNFIDARFKNTAFRE